MGIPNAKKRPAFCWEDPEYVQKIAESALKRGIQGAFRVGTILFLTRLYFIDSHDDITIIDEAGEGGLQATKGKLNRALARLKGQVHA